MGCLLVIAGLALALLLGVQTSVTTPSVGPVSSLGAAAAAATTPRLCGEYRVTPADASADAAELVDRTRDIVATRLTAASIPDVLVETQ